MASSDKKTLEISEILDLLNEDRAFILEQIDKGKWSHLRKDLAVLERELGHLLMMAADKLDDV